MKEEDVYHKTLTNKEFIEAYKASSKKYIKP